jgi:hypothetical protein
LARHFLTPLLMVVWFYEKQSREPLRMFKNAAALWHQDRWKAIIASIANMTLNLTFIHVFPNEYKLDGVIFATLLSDVLIQLPWEAHVVFTKFFNGKQARTYCGLQMLYVLLALLVIPASWVAAWLVPLEGLQGGAVKGLAAGTVAFVILLCIFRKDVLRFIDILFHRKNSSNSNDA